MYARKSPSELNLSFTRYSSLLKNVSTLLLIYFPASGYYSMSSIKSLTKYVHILRALILVWVISYIILTAIVTSSFGSTAKMCFWGSNFFVVFSHIIESECLRKCKVFSRSVPKYNGSQWVNFSPLLMHFLTLSLI